jgi:formylglycine-generating enzyme required for sulfatase activity
VSFTVPPGAWVAFLPVSDETGEANAAEAIYPARGTPLEVELRPGRYLVAAVIEGRGFHEVYRTVPAPEDDRSPGAFKHQSWKARDNGSIEIPAIENIPKTREVTANLIRFAGGKFPMGAAGSLDAPMHQRTLAAFWLAPTEVTVAQYKEIMKDLPQALIERKGRVGDQDAITYVTYSIALEYAERAGLRLPAEAEYEYAATAGGTQDYPWDGDDSQIEAWPFDHVGIPEFDQTATTPPVFGLFSNVAEWTDSRWTPYPNALSVPLPSAVREMNRHSRVVRGGPYSVANNQPQEQEWRATGTRFRHSVDEEMPLGGLGFRCARSDQPRVNPAVRPR